MRKLPVVGVILGSVFLMGCTETLVCIDNRCVEVEIADSENERERGLMYRKSLSENRGMLFVLNEEKEESFWMKNTLIPLDLIWIDENKEIIGVTENAQPCDEKCEIIPSPGKVKYILEVNGGTAKDFEVGERVELHLLNQ